MKPAANRSENGDATRLLLLWQAGDNAALSELFHKLYPDLRKTAEIQMRRERPDHTIQPTALVSEAYLRLVQCGSIQWQNRSHFLAVASRVMRNFLIDYARSRRSQKGGGGTVRVDLRDLDVPSDVSFADVLEVDDLLNRLMAVDSRAAQVFEMRCFGGLTNEEAAVVLGYNERTITRDLRDARAWLIGNLRKSCDDDARAMAAR